jgi:hypothetical protein
MRTFTARRSTRDHIRVSQELLNMAEKRLSDGKEKDTVVNISILAIANVVVGLALQLEEEKRRPRPNL